MTQEKYIRALTIAGSDSGGGAGIQADLKTFSALGAYGLSVITALTAQNSVEVRAIHQVPPEFVSEQLDAVLSDIGADAVKIGMLFESAIIEAVATKLQTYNLGKVTLDPVMVAKSGSQLLKPEAISTLKRVLLPRAEILTPNLPEAELLLDRRLTSEKEIERGAMDLITMGPRAVLIKGGHSADSQLSTDCLAVRSGSGVEIQWLEATRIQTRNTHGTGCTLSAAICAYRARGLEIFDAVQSAKNFLSRALLRGASFGLGHGHGPVYHFADIVKDN